jgi:hypothetical protein
MDLSTIQRLRYEGTQLAKALARFGDARLWSPVKSECGNMVAYTLEWDADVFPWEFVQDTLDSLKEPDCEQD